MANRIPHHFLEQPPETINVSFTDFATGKGIVDFFFGTVGGANRLSETAWYSDLIFKPGTVSTSGTSNQSLDEDFDVDFNKSVTIEGDALATICYAMDNDEAGGGFEVFPIIKIRKWDGSTETDIVSVTGVTKTFDMGANVNLAGISSVILKIPKTTFKKGESLRVTVELWQKSNGTSDLETVFLCDPKGRLTHNMDNLLQARWGHNSNIFDISTLTGAVSTSKIQIPFKT